MKILIHDVNSTPTAIDNDNHDIFKKNTVMY